jgi:outer membrane lipoprotein-sorting protein
MLTFAHEQDSDDQWLYLPALKRVKRISASNRTGPFMGSEFAYEDLAGDEVGKYTYQWLRDEPCPGEEGASRTCFVVERRAKDEDSGYSRQVVWIDQDEYRTIQIDYFDRSGSRLKTLSLADYRQYLERFWRPLQMLMVNDRTGRRTRLEWSSFEFRTGLTANDFTPQSLTRIR